MLLCIFTVPLLHQPCELQVADSQVKDCYRPQNDNVVNMHSKLLRDAILCKILLLLVFCGTVKSL